MTFRARWDGLIEQVQSLYLADRVPWVLGFSGGKDSTATLQLVWSALASLETRQHHKTVHVVCTDTRVENPVVALWASSGIEAINAAANAHCLPINAHRLEPSLEDSFWVNLIGKGYASPRRTFRWCTERLKIKPNSRFIEEKISLYGQVILVLGTRKQESAARGQRMVALERLRTRAHLSPSPAQPNALVYSPIESWSSDDVWTYLLQNANPWGISNKRLMSMYAGASADNECPVVMDASSPSCGSSRFGCWVCTLVNQDASMTAMVANDDEYEWMRPLLDYRDTYLATERDPVTRVALDNEHREYVRANGKPTLVTSGAKRLTYGPYTQTYRATLLRKLLETQETVRELGQDVELISISELCEIRRIWLEDKLEIEDLVPVIYQEATGQEYPDERRHLVLGYDSLELLREICDSNEQYEMARSLLGVEIDMRAMGRRKGLHERLEDVVSRHGYDGPDDALEWALRCAGRMSEID